MIRSDKSGTILFLLSEDLGGRSRGFETGVPMLRCQMKRCLDRLKCLLHVRLFVGVPSESLILE